MSGAVGARTGAGTRVNAPLLAGLIAQAEAAGADAVTLRALVEEAAEAGAARLAARLGLDDAAAVADIAALRANLARWRTARTEAAKAAVSWTVRGIIGGLLAYCALKLGIADLVRQ